LSGFGWQDVVVAALAIGAVVWLVWRRRLAGRPKASPLVGLGRAKRR
jgi:hypothetical protein